jgi:ubiquinone biosynthesis protein UbiJ
MKLLADGYIEAVRQKRDAGSKISTKQLKVISGEIPIITQILKGLLTMTDDQFEKYIPVLYPVLTELIGSDNEDVRDNLKTLFTRVGKIKIYGQK